MKKHDKQYDAIVLLQPTSPFRNGEHLKNAISLYTGQREMVVSVNKTKSNPYFVLYESNEDGWIHKSKKINNLNRRQDVADVYQLNGAIYIINIQALNLKSL